MEKPRTVVKMLFSTFANDLVLSGSNGMSTIAKTTYTMNVENVLLMTGVANLEQGSTILQYLEPLGHHICDPVS